MAVLCTRLCVLRTRHGSPARLTHGPSCWWTKRSDKKKCRGPYFNTPILTSFCALLAFYAGNSQVTGEFPTQRPVTQSSDVFLDLRLNQQWNKQWRRRWLETPSRSLWRYGNVRPEQNGGYFTDNITKCIFLSQNLSRFGSNFTKVCF